MIECFFDFASPYSYLAVARLLKSRTPVTWRPFLLGPIFAERGWNDSPFNVYPDKGRHLWRDLEREAAHYDVPFAKPAQFPINSVLAARVALVGLADGFFAAFTRAAFEANFVHGLDISSEAVIDQLVTDGPAIRARATSPEFKVQLRANVDRAKQLGVFGAPTFFVGDDMFWGNDRLDRALEYVK